MEENTVPYFYIIQQISTNKKYVGCRWTINCNPNDLLKTYFTSSKKMQKIIKENLEDFIVLETVTDFDKQTLDKYRDINEELKLMQDCYVHETLYLRNNKCSTSKEYFNKHNNFKNYIGFNKEISLEKYEVENIGQLEETKEKKKATCLKNYGKEYYIQTEEGKERIKQTNLEKYGVINAINNKDIVEKIKKDCLEKYGVEYHQSRPEIRKKISQSNKGKIFSDEHKENLSKAKKGEFIALDLLTNKKVSISKEMFDSNPDRYVGNTKGYVPVRDMEGNTFMVLKTDPRYISGELIHTSKGVSNIKAIGKANAINVITKESLGRVSLDDIRWETGEICSPLKGISTSLKGSKFMKKEGYPSIQVSPDKFEDYLNNGYVFGRGYNGKGKK